MTISKAMSSIITRLGGLASGSPETPPPDPDAGRPIYTLALEPSAQETRSQIVQLESIVAGLIDEVRSRIPSPAPQPEAQETIMATTAPIGVIIPPATATPAKRTFLQHVGSILKKILHIGEQAAIVAAPIIEFAFPDVLPLFNSAIGLSLAAEGTAAQATGTGTQKLAQVIAGINPLIDKFIADNKLGDMDAGQRDLFVSKIVDAINLIPAPKG